MFSAPRERTARPLPATTGSAIVTPFHKCRIAVLPDLASGSIPRVIPKATAEVPRNSEPSLSFRKTHNWSSWNPGSRPLAREPIRASEFEPSGTIFQNTWIRQLRRSAQATDRVSDPASPMWIIPPGNGHHVRVTVDGPKHGVSVTAVAHRFTANSEPEPMNPGRIPRESLRRITPAPTDGADTPTCPCAGIPDPARPALELPTTRTVARTSWQPEPPGNPNHLPTRTTCRPAQQYPNCLPTSAR